MLSIPNTDPAALDALTRLLTMVTVPTAPAWTDDQIVAEFLADKGNRSGNTRLAYERDIGAYRSFLLLSYGQEARLAPGDATQVAAYERWLRDQVALEALAPATANRRLSALSSFYRWCAKEKRRQVTGVFSNPVDADRHKVVSHFSDRVLTEAQVILLIEAAGAGGPRVRHAARDQALIRLLYHTAARVSEIAALEWRHLQVSPEGGAVAHIIGKGKKDRWVNLSAEVYGQLLAMPGDHAGHIFKSERGGQLNRDTIAAIVRRCGDAIGVAGLSPHVLRHSHATHAIRRGVSPDLVQQTLGHSSLATTSNYLAANPRDSSSLHLIV